MTTGSEWTGRVGESWAHEWQRTDRSFGALTEHLLQSASAEEFSCALDIGCGAGEISSRLAAAHPDAAVLGVDISETLLQAAEARPEKPANVSFELADASQWRSVLGWTPDLLVSRHGVMFFGDPAAAFAHLRKTSKADARLVFSCFCERHENVWAERLASVLGSSASPTDSRAPGPFAFGDPDYTVGLLETAEWSEIGMQRVDYAMIAGEGEDALEDAVSYFLRIGPAAPAIAEMRDAERRNAVERLRKMLSSFQDGNQVSLPASSWIATAKRAD